MKSVGRQAGNVLRTPSWRGWDGGVEPVVGPPRLSTTPDRWAYDRIGKLGGDPLAGASLYQKLLDQNRISNVFVLDEERLAKFVNLARQTQREEMLRPSSGARRWRRLR